MVRRQIIGRLIIPVTHLPARQNAPPAGPTPRLPQCFGRGGLRRQNRNRVGLPPLAGQPVEAIIHQPGRIAQRSWHSLDRGVRVAGFADQRNARAHQCGLAVVKQGQHQLCLCGLPAPQQGIGPCGVQVGQIRAESVQQSGLSISRQRQVQPRGPHRAARGGLIASGHISLRQPHGPFARCRRGTAEPADNAFGLKIRRDQQFTRAAQHVLPRPVAMGLLKIDVVLKHRIAKPQPLPRHQCADRVILRSRLGISVQEIPLHREFHSGHVIPRHLPGNGQWQGKQAGCDGKAARGGERHQ